MWEAMIFFNDLGVLIGIFIEILGLRINEILGMYKQGNIKWAYITLPRLLLEHRQVLLSIFWMIKDGLEGSRDLFEA